VCTVHSCLFADQPNTRITFDHSDLARAEELIFFLRTTIARFLRKTKENTVCSEGRCALRLRYVDLVVSIGVAVEVCCCVTFHSSKMLKQRLKCSAGKMFANKIKQVHACIDARGHHFQHLL
jgi:hypothetical protein